MILTTLLTSCTKIQNQTWTDDDIITPKYEEKATKIDNYLIDKRFSGSVLIGKNGKILFAKGYGVCDKKDKKSPQININTTFEVGSVTKQFTATAIMQLVEQKKLHLDDTILSYFPDYPYASEITIRHLLNMRSGIVDYINAGDEFFPPKVYRDIEKKVYAGKQVEENIVLQYINEVPLMAKPDSTFFYSNTNYYLLAKIIEQVSGIPYKQYIKENLLDKCGMTLSNLEFQNTQTKGYDSKNKYVSLGSEIAFGCGDLNSCVTDLFKWNTMLNQGKILKKKYYKQMIDSQSYGFGFYRHGNMIFHSGVTTVFNSYDAYYLDDKISIIVLTNKMISETNASTIARDIYDFWNVKDKDNRKK